MRGWIVGFSVALMMRASTAGATSIDVGSTAGSPGQQVNFAVTLSTTGQLVAGTQNDIAFDSANTPLAVTRTCSVTLTQACSGDAECPALERCINRPDCSVNPSIGKESPSFTFLPAGCTGAACTRFRVLVVSRFNVDPIPDGSMLYTCRANILPNAASGEYALTISGVVAASPTGTGVPGTTGTSGKIVVLTGVPTSAPAVTPTAIASPTPGGSLCGNSIVEGGEECDDGGICIGGMNAGTSCTSELQCLGNGVCVGGSKVGYGCAGDGDCGDGRCVRCRAFGGDGCASNCTRETEVPYHLVPGLTQGLNIRAGTSGAVVHGDVLTIPLPLTGGEKIVIGKTSPDGTVPFVIPAASVQLPRIAVSTIACACVRAVALKTCGGTVFEPDGAVSPSCTDGFQGQVSCPAKKPCAFVHGPGNSAIGVVGCGDAGLSGVDIVMSQDSGGEGGAPGGVMISVSGSGHKGSASLLGTTAIGTVVGPCSSFPTFCTDADPLSQRGPPQTLPFTTGRATAVVNNANDQRDASVGPFSVTGTTILVLRLRHIQPRDRRRLHSSGSTNAGRYCRDPELRCAEFGFPDRRPTDRGRQYSHSDTEAHGNADSAGHPRTHNGMRERCHRSG